MTSDLNLIQVKLTPVKFARSIVTLGVCSSVLASELLRSLLTLPIKFHEKEGVSEYTH